MSLNAASFINNRSDVISITNERLKYILSYIIDCYITLQTDHPVYSKDYVKTKTTHKFEDYLKFEFVNNYLIANKAALQTKISELEQITFNCETQHLYIDSNDGKNKPDKIDIYINKIGLQNEWKASDEYIYFALECKRILGSQSYAEYLSDIQKFTERNHTKLRLPFEGMIGFIEDASISSAKAAEEVSKKLKLSDRIKTIQYLTQVALNPGFTGSYSSIHEKSYNTKNQFTVYHLMLDYSSNVVA